MTTKKCKSEIIKDSFFFMRIELSLFCLLDLILSLSTYDSLLVEQLAGVFNQVSSMQKGI